MIKILSFLFVYYNRLKKYLVFFSGIDFHSKFIDRSFHWCVHGTWNRKPLCPQPVHVWCCGQAMDLEICYVGCFICQSQKIMKNIYIILKQFFWPFSSIFWSKIVPCLILWLGNGLGNLLFGMLYLPKQKDNRKCI